MWRPARVPRIGSAGIVNAGSQSPQEITVLGVDPPLLTGAPVRATIMLLAVLVAPSPVAAQCVLEGRGAVDAVRPDETDLALEVRGELRVVVEGRRAAVEGRVPIAFRGAARSVDVRAYLAREIVVHEVLRVAAGAPVVIERAGDRALVRIDLDPTVVRTELPCDALTLAAPTTEQVEDRPAGDLSFVRGAQLRLFARSDARVPATTLRRTRGPGGELRGWPPVVVLGADGARRRVRIGLGAGVAEGWVAAADLSDREPMRSVSCCDDASPGVAVDDGVAVTLLAGAELVAGSRTWGRVVVDTPARAVLGDASAVVVAIAGVLEGHLASEVPIAQVRPTAPAR